MSNNHFLQALRATNQSANLDFNITFFDEAKPTEQQFVDTFAKILLKNNRAYFPHWGQRSDKLLMPVEPVVITPVETNQMVATLENIYRTPYQQLSDVETMKLNEAKTIKDNVMLKATNTTSSLKLQRTSLTYYLYPNYHETKWIYSAPTLQNHTKLKKEDFPLDVPLILMVERIIEHAHNFPWVFEENSNPSK